MKHMGILVAVFLLGSACGSVQPLLPPAVGQWTLDDGSGTTAADMLGLHPATLNGGVTWSQDPGRGTTLTFDGSTGYLTTSSPVLTTTSSFTVTAWVKLTDNAAQRTAVSQTGTTWSAFYLQYRQSSNQWNFEMPSADVASPTWYEAVSMSTPALNTWTHLTGVYDSAAETIKLYVNGVLEFTVSNVATFNAPGPLRIGRSSATWWEGNISDVRVYSRALSASEIVNL